MRSKNGSASSSVGARSVTLGPFITSTVGHRPILRLIWQSRSTTPSSPRRTGRNRPTSSPSCSACQRAKEFGPFLAVELNHGASLDYAQVAEGEEIRPQHYAFLVSEDEFDGIYGRIQERGMQHWADPQGQQARRDQPQRRRPRRLLPGSRRALPGNPHPALRIRCRLTRPRAGFPGRRQRPGRSRCTHQARHSGRCARATRSPASTHTGSRWPRTDGRWPRRRRWG